MQSHLCKLNFYGLDSFNAKQSILLIKPYQNKGVGRKISRSGGTNEKKYRKIALLSLFRGGGGNGKKTKNSTIKPLSTISVPCMKIQVERARSPCHVYGTESES